jgi:hypothetical protein
MKKNITVRPTNKLSLEREVIRSLSGREMAAAAGAGFTDDMRLICPEATWGGSKYKTQRY